MNPVSKVRSGAARAWRGTTRTAEWAAGGVAAEPKRAAAAITGATRDARDRVHDGAESVLDRTGATRALERARSNRWVAIAWVAGVLLAIAWIGWAIYSTAEYGASAGLGVLISWPAVIAALALIAVPFVGMYLLVKRLREPAIAGINGGGGNPDGTTAVSPPEEAEDEGDEAGEEAEAESGEENESGDRDESEDD